MENKYLPLGTVITLKDQYKKIVIIGYYGIDYNNVIKVYDYVGTSYPEGLLVANNFKYFNHEDIVKIEFKGYQNDSYNVLNDRLNKQLKAEKNDEKENDNVKYDDNGVVLYDNIKKENTKLTKNASKTELSNPFKIENNENTNATEKTLDVLPKDDNDEENQFVMPHYEFDEDGIIIK